MNRTYFTLKELVVKYKLFWGDNLDVGYPERTTSATYFASLLGNMWEATFSEAIISNEANKLFCTYIAPRNKEMFITYIDGDYEDQDIYNAYKEWMRHYLFILHSTYEKYAKLIGSYESEKANLLDGIKIATETKFNDTPQNVQGSYDWSDDNHLTNVTKNETIADGATKAQRIAELETLINNYYLKWANEFRGLFIYE